MVKEFARAKINLTLDILKKRADGYHEIEMIMQTLELADEVELCPIKNGVELNINSSQIYGGENIPADENNLAWRAVSAVNEYCGKNFGVSINLLKKIPAAAGLGGGSSDAAAVIRGMNWLYDLNLTVEQLCQIGAKIGSDVPFCVVEGTWLARGRGEILYLLPPFKNFSVVLLKPYLEISTAWAYKTFDELPPDSVKHPPTYDIIELFRRRDWNYCLPKFTNVFEIVAQKKFPELESYKSKMIKAGAKVALMSGSGPTVFALAENDDVEKIVDAVKDLPAQIFITKIF